MNRALVVSVVSFFLFLIFQVMLFKKLVLFNTAFCFVYIAFVLLLPIETNPLVIMLVGFALGLLIDMFYDRQGMHAAATVAVAFFRNHWLSAITPQSGYDTGTSPTVGANGIGWFLSYSVPLATLHHLILFFIEAGGFGLTGLTLVKSFASVLFTMTVLVLHQYFFFQRTRS
jgi:hypothetical protein